MPVSRLLGMCSEVESIPPSLINLCAYKGEATGSESRGSAQIALLYATNLKNHQVHLPTTRLRMGLESRFSDYAR